MIIRNSVITYCNSPPRSYTLYRFLFSTSRCMRAKLTSNVFECAQTFTAELLKPTAVVVVLFEHLHDEVNSQKYPRCSVE